MFIPRLKDVPFSVLLKSLNKGHLGLNTVLSTYTPNKIKYRTSIRFNIIFNRNNKSV